MKHPATEPRAKRESLNLGVPAEDAHPYKRDLKHVEFHLLDSGHFALEDNGATIARLIRAFLARHLPSRKSRAR